MVTLLAGCRQSVCHRVAMIARIDFLEDPSDPTLGIDEKRGTRDPHALETEDVLLDPHAVRLGDGVVVVDDESHRQTVLRFEMLMRLGGVRAHSEDFRVESLEPREGVSE